MTFAILTNLSLFSTTPNKLFSHSDKFEFKETSWKDRVLTPRYSIKSKQCEISTVPVRTNYDSALSGTVWVSTLSSLASADMQS